MAVADAAPFELTLRRRTADVDEDGATTINEASLSVTGGSLAVIVCDMWDVHWCAGATRRVGEIAPAMNHLLHALRDAGALIIHAPSDTMGFYEGHPARERAKSAPFVSAPCDVQHWRSCDASLEGSLPIDDSDGGCDDIPVCGVPERMPWTRQHLTLDIADSDTVTDIGQEVHNLLEQFGSSLVLVMGVHTNMCVLGRPFGIRRLVGAGRQVALIRDMTDTMYNRRRPPFVDHFSGTELVIEHIERYWCGTVTSDQFVGGEPFQFRRD